MAKGSSIFAFAAGLAAGAGLTILAITGKGEEFIKGVVDKGEQLLNNGKDVVLSGLDTLESAIKKETEDVVDEVKEAANEFEEALEKAAEDITSEE